MFERYRTTQRTSFSSYFFFFFTQCDIIFLLAGVTGDSAYIITNLLDREAISRKQTGQTDGPLSRPNGGENSPWRSVISERHQRRVRSIGRKNETHCCGVTPIQYQRGGWGGSQRIIFPLIQVTNLEWPRNNRVVERAFHLNTICNVSAGQFRFNSHFESSQDMGNQTFRL